MLDLKRVATKDSFIYTERTCDFRSTWLATHRQKPKQLIGKREKAANFPKELRLFKEFFNCLMSLERMKGCE